MPHWNDKGEQEWVCQKGAHVCTGSSKWIDRDSEAGIILKVHGNVCVDCLVEAGAYIVKNPMPRTLLPITCKNAIGNIVMIPIQPHGDPCFCVNAPLLRSDW